MTAASLFGDPPDAARCPECGAVLNAGQTRCWLCHRSLAIDAELIVEAPPPRLPNPLQFSLESLLLVVTLIAVCLGALVSVPGIGIMALVIAVPALIRACLTGIAAKREGRRLTTTDKVMAFLASAGIAWAALVAAGMAFFGTCTASLITGAAIEQAGGSNLGGAMSQVLLWGAVILCCATSLAAFVGMFWITWPKRGAGR